MAQKSKTMQSRTMCSFALTALLALTVAPAHAAPSTARLKAFARLPDWSGIWTVDVVPTDASGRYQNDKGYAAFKFAGQPPYNAAWQADYEKRLAAANSKVSKGCIIDFPATMESPQPFELSVTPEQTVYIAGDGTFRQIHTDGRAHLKGDDLWPTVTGVSVGHWEGQTLVVDTIARSPGPDRFLGMAAYSEKAHFSERIRLTGKDTMEDLMTIDDPVAFTHPWTVKLAYRRVTYINHLDPYYCEINDRIEIKDGEELITPSK